MIALLLAAQDSILWQKSAAEALKAAGGKPILVFMVVGKYGRKDAADC